MDILIEELNGSLWAASLKNGRLEGLEVDSPYEEVRWGSIYWGKVKTIDKAQDAVYVDLDGDNTGILYNKDVRRITKEGAIEKGGDQAIGKTLKPGDMICVQAKSAYITNQEGSDRLEDKIPKLSMDITLPGRYLIYCPMMQNNRLSLRIRDKNLRTQLKTMLSSLQDTKGCILRAAAANTQTDLLVREARILKESWTQVQNFLEGDQPSLIMLGPDAIQRTLSDQATELIDRIELTTMDHYTLAEEWCSVFAPDLVTKILPQELDDAQDDLALFHERDIIGQIEALSQAYAFLPGGGHLIIQETAALIAIDVNRGADRTGHLSINAEAIKEALRQIRLRNLGGMILIDALRLKNKKEENALNAIIEDMINLDPCTIQFHGKSNLGLLELTRKRRTPTLNQKFDGILE